MRNEMVGNDKIVSFDDELLVLVDENDEVLGYKDKNACHVGQGILHRAFSVFIFNSKNELILHQRSAQKRLWNLYWTNSCCSHPRKGESYEVATQRRVKEELGLTVDLTYLYKFQYQAGFGEKGSENELCSVYIGKTDVEPIVNPNEISAWRYISIDEMTEELNVHPEKYTPWFTMEWKMITEKYLDKVKQL
jgi:isopentenyl-diphosphate delta-isomerase